MAQFRQPAPGTFVSTLGGEVVLKKRVFGYVLRTDGATNAVLKLYLGTSAGVQIWEDEVIAGDLAKISSFAEAPLGDDNASGEELPVAAVVSGDGAFAYIRNH